ncbi:MAG: hypothetical protein P4L53_10335 [Candidatus Obscuribacterales bacterium]|nr:hypothetical protein [Candidatus Obscuribacterales bacterium]
MKRAQKVLVSKFFNPALSLMQAFTLMMCLVASSIPVLALDSDMNTKSSDKISSSEGKTMTSKGSIPG